MQVTTVCLCDDLDLIPETLVASAVRFGRLKSLRPTAPTCLLVTWPRFLSFYPPSYFSSPVNTCFGTIFSSARQESIRRLEVSTSSAWKASLTTPTPRFPMCYTSRDGCYSSLTWSSCIFGKSINSRRLWIS